MSPQKNHLVLGFLIAGIAFLFTAWLITYKTDSGFNKTGFSLARVERETGNVFILKSSPFQKIKINKFEQAYQFESVETDEIGEALLTFPNGYRVKLYEDSLIMLERREDKPLDRFYIILKKGNLRVENFGPQENLWISRDGKNISANEYNTSDWVMSEVKAPSVDDKLHTETTGLTEEEISTVMTANKNYFFKCYTQLLQNSPQAKGEVTLSFTIENSGKISVSDATSVNLNYPDFKKCLMEVVSRIEFKPFTGPPVSTLFPLKFE